MKLCRQWLSASVLRAHPRRVLLTALLLAGIIYPVGVRQALADCRQMIPTRPRIYFPAPGYGRYATLRDRWRAAQKANTPEYQALVSQAAGYLKTEPNALYYPDVAFEEAFLYALDPVQFASAGPRALNLLNKAIDTLAPAIQITAALNQNPVVFTSRGHGLADGKQYTVWGGAGAWAAVNNARATVKVIDADTFSIAVDATSFGPLSGTLTVSTNSLMGLNQARWYNPVLAAVWDWAHDQIPAALSPDQQAKIMNALSSAAITVSSNWYVDPNPFGGIANLVVGPMNGALQLAIALNGDVPGMDAVCESTRKKFLEVVPQSYTTGGQLAGMPIYPLGHGGAPVESTEYAPEVSFYLVQYMLTLRGATGEDFFPLLQNWYRDHMLYLYHSTSPAPYHGGRQELFPFGDVLLRSEHHGASGVLRQVVEQLAYYFASAGDDTHLGYAQWWLQNIAGPQTVNETVSPGLAVPNEFLWYDSSLPAAAPTLPADYIADGLGIVLSRSSWDPNATWLALKGGALRGSDEDHFHGDVLTFSLYRRGEWLTNELLGWGNNFGLTQFHNAPLPDSGMPLYYSGSNPPLRSGQRISSATARVVQYEAAADQSYMYAEADATPVYRGSSNQYTVPPFTATVNTMVRDYLYLKPDVLVISDRLAYDEGHPATARWLLQALADPGQPADSNFTIGSAEGTQVLNVSVVSPAQPLYNVVSPETQITEAGAAASRQWRIEISSGNSTEAEQYMVVLQAGDSGFSPLPVRTLTARDLNAAQFGNTVVAALTDTRTQGATRSYTYQPSNAPLKHIVMGLLPNTAYSVSRSLGGQIDIADGRGDRGDVMTTAGGLLIFQTGDTTRHR